MLDAVIIRTNRLTVLMDKFYNAPKISKFDHNLLRLLTLTKDPWIVTGCDINEIVRDMSEYLTNKTEKIVIKKETLSHAFKHGAIKIDVM